MGVITSIGEAHLDGFGSVDGVARAKAELVTALGSGGTAVLNWDDLKVRAIGHACECPVIWFGTDSDLPESGVRGDAISLEGDAVSLRCGDGIGATIRAAGRH